MTICQNSVGSQLVLSFGARIIEKYQVEGKISSKRHYLANLNYFVVDRIVQISKDGQNCKLSYSYINYNNNNNNNNLIFNWCIRNVYQVSIRPVGLVS